MSVAVRCCRQDRQCDRTCRARRDLAAGPRDVVHVIVVSRTATVAGTVCDGGGAVTVQGGRAVTAGLSQTKQPADLPLLL